MKYALIIGNNRYTDQKLAQLKTPAADSQALARVLREKSIGSFDEVLPLVNKTEFQVSRAISTFLANKKPEDLVLVYFSGHGILDDRGRLFLALKDTQTNLLKSTAISASFIADEMDSCRSKRQILILDCCHSGAFGRGAKGEAQKAVTETTFEGVGFGRVVLTASDSTQYAFEGNQVIEQTELSLFTHFLLEGLETGKADLNNDGYIALDEWYDYTYTQVLSSTPKQVPHKWSYHQQGDLIIAKNPFMKKKVVELPEDLLRLLESPYSTVREVAVKELGELLHSRSSEYAELARLALEKLTEDDSRTVSLAAIKQLSEFQRPVEEREVAEKIARQKLESEAAQKIEHEVVEKAKREKARRQAAQMAALKETSSKSFNTLKTPLPRAKPFITAGGVIGIILLLFWVGSWAVPKLFSTAPTAQASITPGSITTITSSNSPIPFTKTVEAHTTPTKTKVPTATPRPFTFSAYDSFLSGSSARGFDPELWSEKGEQATISSQNGYLVFSATEGSKTLSAIAPEFWKIDQIGRLQADLRIDSIGEGFDGSLGISIQARLPNEQGIWLVSCSVWSYDYSSPAVGCQGYRFHRDGTDTNYSSDPIPIEFGEFHTVAIEIDPDASYVRYFVNGTTIGEFRPKEMSLMAEADFEWYIFASGADGAIDSVAVGKIE
jgi:hypothetical protein